jgi:Icc protein
MDAPVLRVLHLTDTHILAEPGRLLYGVDSYRRTRDLLEYLRRNLEAPDLILHSGDCADTPSPAAYARLKELLSGFGKTPCLMLPGNHDDPALLKAAFPKAVVPHVVRGHWLFVLLDSTRPDSPAGRLGEDELARLEATLARYPDHPALVALHHPPLPVGSPWMDAMILAEDGSACLSAILRRSRNVRLVLCGHAHQEREWMRNRVRFYLTPSTVVQFRPGCEEFALDDRPPACRWLELYPGGSFASRVFWLPE